MSEEADGLYGTANVILEGTSHGTDCRDLLCAYTSEEGKENQIGRAHV